MEPRDGFKETQTENGTMANITCGKCNGSGQFHLKVVQNGRVAVKVDICYACRGKGTMTHSDIKRNDIYWKHNFVRIANGG